VESSGHNTSTIKLAPWLMAE